MQRKRKLTPLEKFQVQTKELFEKNRIKQFGFEGQETTAQKKKREEAFKKKMRRFK